MNTATATKRTAHPGVVVGLKAEVAEVRHALRSAFKAGCTVKPTIESLDWVLEKVGPLEKLDVDGVRVVRTVLSDARWLLSEALGQIERKNNHE